MRLNLNLAQAMYENLLVELPLAPFFLSKLLGLEHFVIQGGFFNWPPPKNYEFKKKSRVSGLAPPKISKCQLR